MTGALLRRQRQADRRAVHVSGRAALLLVLLTLRLARTLARLHAYLAADYEEVTAAVAAECANLDCANTASNTGDGLCYVCAGMVQRDQNILLGELDKVLSLEAQFVAYCVERGLPNPHED